MSKALLTARIYREALRGLTRCNAPAKWAAPNGYRVCAECYFMENSLVEYRLLYADGPGPYGQCDRCVDGMGAHSWPQRLAATRARLTGKEAK